MTGIPPNQTRTQQGTTSEQHPAPPSHGEQSAQQRVPWDASTALDEAMARLRSVLAESKSELEAQADPEAPVPGSGSAVAPSAASATPSSAAAQSKQTSEEAAQRLFSDIAETRSIARAFDARTDGLATAPVGTPAERAAASAPQSAPDLAPASKTPAAAAPVETLPESGPQQTSVEAAPAAHPTEPKRQPKPRRAPRPQRQPRSEREPRTETEHPPRSEPPSGDGSRPDGRPRGLLELWRTRWVRVLVISVAAALMLGAVAVAVPIIANPPPRAGGDAAAESAASTGLSGDELLTRVGSLMVLPEEAPTIATVEDPATLSAEPFFARAQTGDRVLIFPESRLAVLYRESQHLIINAGTLSVGVDPAARADAPIEEAVEPPAEEAPAEEAPAEEAPAIE
jgi:hypothetical protein